MSCPLILTLRLDLASSAFFEAERQRHFPPDRNVIPAHVTLFHHLPGEREAAIQHDLREATGEHAPFALVVDGLRFLGRGVAYRLRSEEFTALRERLSRRWAADLTPQDRQKIAPQVTVQNKVDPARARALFERLSARFEPFPVRAEGLLLWRYLGGPWSLSGGFDFGAPTGNTASPP